MKRYWHTFFFVLALGMILVAARPAAAQVEYLTPAQQKKEVRKSLKEAQKIKTDYNESHLNLKAYNFERGASGRKRVKNPQDQDEMLMNEDGTAVTKPKSKPKKAKKRKQKQAAAQASSERYIELCNGNPLLV
ncbi:hypothetical protein [Rufibacter quisquiliarum]|uniref:Putative membrane protein n=1 Tax=Rufibacter quisquiliarum TaxID=1549639 RepID=A0A839GUW1_9BACT|nr:hypothetical protein [Rufibacter quisquiliarum]MBA9077571.1 putative membrane protein [Rufibacter quisquiliarum]